MSGQFRAGSCRKKIGDTSVFSRKESVPNFLLKKPRLLEANALHIIRPGKGVNKRPYIYVIGSAILFGLSTPASKLLLKEISPLALAGLLYLGAFLGLAVFSIGKKIGGAKNERHGSPLQKKDWGWLAGATASGGILGPICLLFGLARISGYAASLLLNLEGVATALIAVKIFKENAGRKTWFALASMTCAGIFLSWDPGQNRFALTGSLLVLAAMVFWGIDNNLTRNIADKDPVQIARIKGFVAGAFSLGLAFLAGMKVPLGISFIFGLALGALSYGLSLVLYIKALGGLGAFRAGAFFSFAPFVGALASLLVLPEPARWIMIPGAVFMTLGVFLVITEKHEHHHRHERLVHAHSHGHGDGHHFHRHEGALDKPHGHEHTHEEMDHIHGHCPDIHHRHEH